MSKPIIVVVSALWLTVATLVVDSIGLTSTVDIVGGSQVGGDVTASGVSSGIGTLLNMLFFQVEGVPALVNIIFFWIPMLALLWILIEGIINFLAAVIPL